MENLKVEQSLNLSINKEDLINIKIDEMLTSLENELKSIQAQISAIDEDMTIFNKKEDDLLEKKLLKFLPKELSTKEIPEIFYYSNSNSTKVCFNFEKYTVEIQNMDTRVKKFSEERLILKKELNQQIYKIQVDIAKIEKSTKRIQAKMIKELLSSSVSGKEILTLLNKNKELHLLK
jgi:predicted  nucleic acid-binding Zn-ribbon protein